MPCAAHTRATWPGSISIGSGNAVGSVGVPSAPTNWSKLGPSTATGVHGEEAGLIAHHLPHVRDAVRQRDGRAGRRHGRVAAAEVDSDLTFEDVHHLVLFGVPCSGGPNPRGATNSTSASPESEPPAPTFTVARWFRKKWWSPWSAGTDWSESMVAAVVLVMGRSVHPHPSEILSDRAATLSERCRPSSSSPPRGRPSRRHTSGMRCAPRSRRPSPRSVATSERWAHSSYGSWMRARRQSSIASFASLTSAKRRAATPNRALDLVPERSRPVLVAIVGQELPVVAGDDRRVVGCANHRSMSTSTWSRSSRIDDRSAMTPPRRMRRTAESWTDSRAPKPVDVTALGPQHLDQLVAGHRPAACDHQTLQQRSRPLRTPRRRRDRRPVDQDVKAPIVTISMRYVRPRERPVGHPARREAFDRSERERADRSRTGSDRRPASRPARPRRRGTGASRYVSARRRWARRDRRHDGGSGPGTRSGAKRHAHPSHRRGRSGHRSRPDWRRSARTARASAGTRRRPPATVRKVDGDRLRRAPSSHEALATVAASARPASHSSRRGAQPRRRRLEDHALHAIGIGRREHQGHRATLGRAHQIRAIDARVVEHRRQLVDPLVEPRDVEAAIRHPGPPLVERHEPTERREPLEHPPDRRPLPRHLDVLRHRRHRHDRHVAVADDWYAIDDPSASGRTGCPARLDRHSGLREAGARRPTSTAWHELSTACAGVLAVSSSPSSAQRRPLLLARCRAMPRRRVPWLISSGVRVAKLSRRKCSPSVGLAKKRCPGAKSTPSSSA